MEFQQSDKQCNEQYNNILFYEQVISLFIIYIIFIMIIIIFIKLIVELMKKSIEEKPIIIEEKELLDNEEELLTSEEKELLDEEELLTTDEEKLLTTDEEELLDNKEELLTTDEEELLDDEEELLDNEEELSLVYEEELLLANYNTKERALALQAAYKEQLQILFEKRKNITIKLNTSIMNTSIDKGDGINLACLCDGSYSKDRITNSLTVNDILLNTIVRKMHQSIIKDMISVDEEILIIAKKAGLFQVSGDLLKYLQKFITQENPIYDDCKNVLLNM